MKGTLDLRHSQNNNELWAQHPPNGTAGEEQVSKGQWVDILRCRVPDRTSKQMIDGATTRRLRVSVDTHHLIYWLQQWRSSWGLSEDRSTVDMSLCLSRLQYM